MTGDGEDKVRERAHAIWEREGRPEGRHEEHWRQASQETGSDDGGSGAGDAATGSSGEGDLGAGRQPDGTPDAERATESPADIEMGGGAASGATNLPDQPDH